MKDKILIVDDDMTLCKLLMDILIQAGYEACSVTNGAGAIELLEREDFHLVLLDLILPGMDGMDIFRHFLKTTPDLTVIIMSGHGTIARAVEATKLGAYDFVEKPLEKERLLLTVRNALDKARLLRSRSLLIDEVTKRYDMVAVSPVMQKIFTLIDRIAPTNSTVMIMGESGSGKELIARAIHINSNRASYPFVQLNCAAIPEELIESELFGHIKGSFTGAIRNKNGKFQQANQGTLFLDEIADLSSRAQAKVLRVIEDGEVARIGSDRHEVVDTRLISATNQDLIQLVEQKKFREDLFHRLNVIPITVPPLRDRPEDILPLLSHFIQLYCQANHFPPKKILPDAEAVLIAYPWHGNVRELKHFIEKLVVLVEDEFVNGAVVSHLLSMESPDFESKDSATLQIARENFERSYILQALHQHEWNVSRTANQLGLARTHLYRKLQKLNIQLSTIVSEK